MTEVTVLPMAVATNEKVSQILREALARDFDHVIVIGLKGDDLMTMAPAGLSLFSCIGNCEVAKSAFLDRLNSSKEGK